MTQAAEGERPDGPARISPAADGRRERILDAAERLFARRGFGNVSVRDIADEAQVTHPLIYYYWRSKDDLLAATLARAQTRVREVPAHIERLETVAAIARESLENNRQYLLTLTRALLDGMPPAEWPGGFPGVDAVVRMAVREAPAAGERDARARVAGAVAMLYGWATIEEALLEIVGLTSDDREQAREVLFTAIRDVLRPLIAR